ncbi:MAG: hypothetical protein K2K86_00585, partial [Muribaculaceae bacterium]|nr:hypothetical protein [Muribaculaceae bacterium]
MNNIITLDQLAAELAQRANIPTDDALAAILALEHQITADLTDVKAEAEIPHIGTFRVTDAQNGAVVFN